MDWREAHAREGLHRRPEEIFRGRHFRMARDKNNT